MATLVECAPELIHKIALSGWLTFHDVKALALSCKKMKAIFVDDDYGRNIHHALEGVMENVWEKRWASARYAVQRTWFVVDQEDEATLWKDVAEAVVGDESIDLLSKEELKGWETVMLAVVSLPAAAGCLETWVSPYSDEEMSLLDIAVELGGGAVVDWVVEHGGNLDIRDPYEERTPLFHACALGDLSLVKKLIDGGADIMTRNRISRSLLHAASVGGDGETVRYVLGLGVFDVDERDDRRETPLGIACSFGHADAVKALVEHKGADIDPEALSSYKGPLTSACRSGNMDVVRVLLDAGALGGVEELTATARKGHAGLVSLFLARGVGVDAMDACGDTALSAASYYGHVDVVNLLLSEAGADVNKTASKGRTPLFWACLAGKADVVALLLQAGADASIGDGRATPVEVAREKGWHDVVELLAAADS